MISLISYVAGLSAIACAVGVVASKRSIHTAISLIGNILSLAVLFLVYDAQFMAFVLVAVYGGAVLILFLFVIALLAAGKTESEDEYGPELVGQVAGGTGLALLFATVLLIAFNLRPLGLAASVPSVPGFGSIQFVGQALFTTYLVPFELTAPILLSAIVGVVVLAGDRA